MIYYIKDICEIRAIDKDRYEYLYKPTGQKDILSFKYICLVIREFSTHLEKNFRDDKRMVEDLEKQGFKIEAKAVRVKVGRRKRPEFRYSIVGYKKPTPTRKK